MRKNPLYEIASFLAYSEAKGSVKSSYLPCWTTEKTFDSILGRIRTFYTGSRPIKDQEIEKSIKNIDINELHNDANIDKKLSNIIYDWLLESKNFKFDGIKNFPHFYSTFGVVQSIDSFFLRFQKQKIGVTKNEYWYVYEVGKNNNIYQASLDTIIPNSVVICSSPHSYMGDTMNDFILKAKSLNCYVAVDLTFAPLSMSQCNLNFECIDEFWISLNKTWPVATYRNGFRFSKKPIDDPISWISSMPLTNRVGSGIILNLMKNYDINYINEKYADTMQKICKSCNLEQTNILTIAKSNDYKNYFEWTVSKFNENTGERINLSSVIENYDLLKEKNLI